MLEPKLLSGETKDGFEKESIDEFGGRSGGRNTCFARLPGEREIRPEVES